MVLDCLADDLLPGGSKAALADRLRECRILSDAPGLCTVVRAAPHDGTPFSGTALPPAMPFMVQLIAQMGPSAA